MKFSIPVPVQHQYMLLAGSASPKNLKYPVAIGVKYEVVPLYVSIEPMIAFLRVVS